ncbi:MAG TPA: hypothetical protein ENK84_03510 [Desulfobulbus sp.]|nr:hypothetical protein [Desulfobulbus sp.]
MEATDQNTATNSELKGFQDLFLETWAEYKSRGLTILGVMLVAGLIMLGILVLLGVVAAVFLGGMEHAVARIQQGQLNGSVTGIFALFFCIALVFGLWSQSATIAAAVDESLGVVGALKVGWHRLWAMGWILLLVSSIVITGFILFVVPGIFLSVTLMFALYPLYEEDLRGMDAVLASHYCVKGRWWNTFGKLLLIWLIALILDLIPFVGQVLYVLFTPFLFLFMVALYRNLRESSHAQPSGVGLWWLMAGIGMILPVFGLVGAIVTLGPQLPTILQQIEQQYQEAGRIGSGRPPVAPHPLSPTTTTRPKVSVAGKEHQEVWHDPVGDTVDFGVGHWLDIATVSVRAADNILHLDIQMHFPLTAAFNAASTTPQPLYRPTVVYFDTDVDRRTGGRAGKKAVRSGYDYGLDITLESPRNAPKKGQVHVALFRVVNGMRKFLGPLPDNQVHAAGKSIQVALPYGTLGLQAGKKLRLSFVEFYQKQGSGLSKDKLIDL